MPSLIDAQANLVRFGAMEWRFIRKVREPRPDEPMDPEWRRFDPNQDEIEVHVRGLNYGELYPTDNTVFYYWRRDPERLDTLRSLQNKVAEACAERGLVP